jgi:thioesterase domain-containing protein/acyl carrier protein
LNGARLVGIAKETLLNPQALASHLRESGITSLFLTTALFNQIAQELPTAFASLDYLLFGGEQVEPRWVAKVLAEQPPRHLLHVYGPTENTTFSTWYPLTQVAEGSANLPIGKPLANSLAYVLDVYHQPVPIGVPGELYVAGAGLARGYLHRPQLTAATFLELELFGQVTRVYKTGDLARWLPNGNLEYLGRMDHQVKLRGFRIELGEIEAILMQHEAVKEAVVVLRKEDMNPQLVAYVTRNATTNLAGFEDRPGLTGSIAENATANLAGFEDSPGLIADFTSMLLTWLATRLPDYMIPTSMMVLEKLPLTPNGKIDRRALPAPSATLAKRHAIPRDYLELQLVQLWEELLNVHPIGITDHFFELGGHSLLAVKLMSQIQHRFGKQLPLATLFQAPTIVQLAENLRSETAFAHTSLVAIQPYGQGIPLFCLPGAGGHVLYFHAFASQLGTQQPVFGLETPGLDGTCVPPTSIEAHAQSLLTYLQQRQPQGPYYLAGHSAGGIVAFELARQLEQRGERVAQLLIFDTTLMVPSNFLTDLTGKSELDWLWEWVEAIAESEEQALTLSRTTLAALIDDKARWQLVAEYLHQRKVLPSGMGVEQIQLMMAVYQAANWNAVRYRPTGTIQAPIVVFRAQEPPPIEWQDSCYHRSDWGWQDYTATTVKVIWVPGSHQTMLNSPQVQTLVTHVQQLLG